MDENTLIDACFRLKQSDASLTAAQVLAALEAEGHTLTLSEVKKACNKAAKRQPVATAPAPSAATPVAEPSEAKKAKLAKQAAAAEKQKNAEIKSAENAMMEAQRKLRGAKSGDPTAPITVTGEAAQFVQEVTMRAITGVLEPGDADFLALRIEADIAALEWVKLASASGAIQLSEDMVALGGELQLARLKDARGADGSKLKDVAAARACYVEKGGEDEGYTRLDRMMARNGALAAGGETGDKMEEMD